jgi:hypothetical protein
MQNFDKIKMFKVHESVINFYSPIFFASISSIFSCFARKKSHKYHEFGKLNKGSASNVFAPGMITVTNSLYLVAKSQ